MFNFLEKIRQKPEHERQRILVVSATLITSIIVIIWASLLYARYLLESQKEKTIQRSASPFEVFFKDLGQKADTLKGSYKNVQNIINEVSQEADRESFIVSSSTGSVGTTSEAEILPSVQE